MTSAQLEIQLIALLVAATCALPGTFLVLRKMAMISDAISHSILLGIVLGFFITHNISSPLLILLATITGVITTLLVEWIYKTGLVKEDTAIGLVFPALFSIGVILISRNAGDVHLDTDAVLLGELAFAPFDRLIISGKDIGPKSLYTIGCIFILNLVFLLLFFKELKISTFDTSLATALGLTPSLIHYALMFSVSITTVGSFDAVGAILVVAFLIVPAAIAYLLTDNLKKMLYLSVITGVVAAISGYWVAHFLDASIAGTIATMLGIIFLFTFLFATDRGLLSMIIKRKKQKKEFSLLTLLLHIKNHSFEKDEENERSIEHLTHHLRWNPVKSRKTIKYALSNNMINIENNIISLTDKGVNFTEETISFIMTGKMGEVEKIKSKFLLFRG